jgi:hypothetical protein
VRKDVEASTIVPGSQQTVVPTGTNERPFWERFGFRSDGTQIMVFRRGAHVYAQVEGVDTIQLDPDGGDNALNPDVKVSADGTAVATWTEDNAYWARVLPPISLPQEWGPVHRITDEDVTIQDFTTAISDEGTAYAAWSRDTGDLEAVEVSIMDPDDPTRSPGTPYQFQPVPDALDEVTEVPEEDRADADQPTIDVDPAGNATVAYRRVIGVAPGETRRTIEFVRNFKAPPAPPPVIPGPGPGGPGPGAPGPAPDVTPPHLTAFHALRSTFAEGSKEGKVVVERGEKSAAVSRPLRVPLKVGTKLRWTADEAGTAHISIQFTGCFSSFPAGSPVPPGDRCNSRRHDGIVKTFSLKSKRGKNSKTWLGKTDPGSQLRVGGRYTASLRVTDAADNRSRRRRLELHIDAPRD